MNYSYETLDYVGRLELEDPFGLEARFSWYQRVRVLTPELLTIFQKTWGDGDRLARIASTSADLAHQMISREKDVLVFALKKPTRVGDVVEFQGVRRIHHGFKEKREWWEFTPFTPTARARIVLSYPLGKDPEAMSVSMSRGSPAPYVHRSGTKQLLFSVKSPVVGSTYRTEWSW